ncbi:hypothetical protein SAMN04489799_2556 [Pseudomonas azotoformans]|nr:hypothetical protein SAMN04489799_2556 [Pseudomonas azotoformans]
MALGQSLMSWLTHRHRGQAPSHSLIFMYQLKGGLLWLRLWLWLWLWLWLLICF